MSYAEEFGHDLEPSCDHWLQDDDFHDYGGSRRILRSDIRRQEIEQADQRRREDELMVRQNAEYAKARAARISLSPKRDA